MNEVTANLGHWPSPFDMADICPEIAKKEPVALLDELDDSLVEENGWKLLDNE